MEGSRLIPDLGTEEGEPQHSHFFASGLEFGTRGFELSAKSCNDVPAANVGIFERGHQFGQFDNDLFTTLLVGWRVRHA